ncbi:MAG: helix-turn-helix domain-containing protein [Campylobacterota bacterium]|nr:helix-turn-helix domain-containing protein [Campylobacterota bacterium]
MIHLTELIGKSERTVERIFKKYFNLSPYTYLKIHRLNRIRNYLIQANNPSTVNITHTAMANGFMHMGYFASEYKKTFGERPSDTLQRVS